ncbi:Os06g0118600 [Oryza sativa Japonica Group]|uniref:Os06g0118600 protein n=1 Tax=Oryza sativa subsp. japonica TaxID=39947 RepID=A0A0P0WS96_ORYSJ|nr:hypothetical protein EE612_031597 [Oryza sativa]BAS95867.1 Os06g0118600 [Oryza sativa Japonica Group]
MAEAGSTPAGMATVATSAEAPDPGALEAGPAPQRRIWPPGCRIGRARGGGSRARDDVVAVARRARGRSARRGGGGGVSRRQELLEVVLSAAVAADGGRSIGNVHGSSRPDLGVAEWWSAGDVCWRQQRRRRP